MLSLVAMAALPMAGLADALVPEVGEGKWQTEDDADLREEEGLLVSIGGSTITKKLTLVPGTYSVNAGTSNNAVIEVEANGQTYRKGVSFTLEEAGDVTVKLSADTYGEKFTVGGLTLTLYYDFNAAHATLRDMLNGAYSKLSNGKEADPWEKELNEAYNGQNGLLLQLFSIQDGTDDAYKVYKEQELYRGVENSIIYEEVQKYVKEVDECMANKQAYEDFKKTAEVWQETNLVELQATLDNDAKDQKTKEFYQGEVDALKTEVADFLTELETKYEAREAVKYTTEVKGEWAEKMPEKISELQAKIQAFDKVMQAVTEATDESEGYNTKVAELIKDINATGRYKEILADVKETLAEDYKPVYEVEQFIKNKDNDPRDDKEANIKKVTDAKKKMQEDYDLYKKRLDHYTAAYVDLDDFQKRLNTVTKGMEDIKNTEYNDEISDIQKLLDAIDKKFQQGMEDNMDLPVWSEDKTEVEKRLGSLETETQATLDNYNAWVNLKADIETRRNNLTEANNNVATYVSEDKAYTATDYWTAVSEEIDTTIDALENDVTAAYEDGKAVDFKNNSVEQQRFTAIQTKIDDFDRTAKAAFDDYVTVQNKLKEWQIALGTVQGFVTNRDVIMSDGTTTYGEALDEAAQAINTLQTNLQTALGLKDYYHADEMSSLAATQKPAVLDKTQADFETDLQNYSADRALKDAIKLAGTVSELKTEVEGQRQEKQDEFDLIPATELGLRFNTIEQQLKDYATTLSGMQIVGATSITKDNAIAVQKVLSEQMRTLYNIQEGIEAINLEQIKADVKKNNDTYNQLSGNFSTLEEEIRKINDFTATSGQFAKDSYNKDPRRSDDFENEESKLLDKWRTLTAGLNEALQNETVVTGDWQKKYDEFAAEVTKAVDAAKASTDNWNAYNELLNKIRDTFYPKLNEDGTERGDLIDMEKEEVKAIATPENAGQQHFLGELDRYRTQLETQKGEIEQAYDKRTCATRKAELDLDIESLESSIKGTSDQAQANEKKHNLLLDKETETLTLWNTVYDKLSGEDQSTHIMTWLDQLRNIKTLFDKTVGDVEDNFGNGAYSNAEKYTEDDGLFNGYSKEIDEILAKWAGGGEGGYLWYLVQDNYDRYEAFVNALTEARTTFNNVVKSLAKFQNITDEELLVNFDEVIEVNQVKDLYKYNEKFRELQSNAESEFYTAAEINRNLANIENREEWPENPAAFDLEEDFRKTAEGYTTDINKIYKRTTEALNATSQQLLSEALDAAEQAVSAAETAIAGYHNEVKANAFAEEKHDIQTGRNWLKDNYRELAVELANGFLTKIRVIGDSVLAECEILAQQEYDKVYEKLQADDEDARLKLATCKVPEGDGTDYQQLYEDAYNQYISGEGGFIAIGTDAKAQNCMFSDDGLKAAMYQYKLFKQKNGYDTFCNKVQDKASSDAAYKILMGEQGVVNSVQGIIDAARTYANAYFITNPGIETVQGTLNSIVAAIEAAKAQGTVHSTDFETGLQSCENTAIRLNYWTNVFEKEELKSQIEHLRYEYNQAVATGKVKAEEQVAYEKTIKGYQDELDNIYYNYLIYKDEDAAQAAFIDLEGKIAASRTEITKIFNEELIDALYDELQQLATDVQNLCNANSQNLEENCHKPVQKLFADKLEHVAEEATMAAGKIEEYWEAGTLLFYSERLNNTLEQLKNSLTTMAEAIEQAEAPYDVNDAACERLQDKLNGYKARYEALNEKLRGYAHCHYDDWFLSDNRFADWSDADQQRLTRAQEEYATDPSVMLTEDAALLYSYEALLLYLDRTYSYYEAAWSVEEVRRQLAKANDELEGYSCIQYNEVYTLYNEIYNGCNHMDVFNAESKGTDKGGGIIWADIDGNKFYNEWGVEVSKSISWAAYVSDCVPAVFSRCEELLGEVDEYRELIEASRYLIGDVNEDTKVLVDDYTTILRHTLGAELITEARLLAAADANFDGAVNIGDLTAVARIITGTDDVQPVAAPSRVRSIIAPSADALTVRFEGEGVHQRIAISVDASRLYAGAQMDIRLPEGITLSAATAGVGAEGFAVHTNALENGMHRVVLTSLEGLTFAENSDALLWLDVQVDHNYNGEGVEISNILFSDTMAHVYSLQAPAGEATGLGTVSMTEEVKEKIYNVGGILMDGLKRGVNIIRGNDGTSKKVIIK